MSRRRGSKTYWSGSQYDGEMLNGKRHGRGTKTWPNGDKYDGEWQFDKKDGRGTLSPRQRPATRVNGAPVPSTARAR